MKVGIEVITGFLGAGKSAFINFLVDKTYTENEKVIILTCEKGNTEINEIKDKEGFVKHISIVNDERSLNDLINYVIRSFNPHRVIIEYNGTESLENIYKCLFNNKTEKLVKLNNIYFVCDGRNIEFYIKNMGELLMPFIQNSDVILINNCISMKKEEMESIINLLGKLNHKAHILKAKDNDDIGETLEKSNLIESNLMRSMRVKFIEYIRKQDSR